MTEQAYSRYSRNKRKKRGGCLKWLLIGLILVLVAIGLIFAKLYFDTKKLTDSVFVQPDQETQQPIRESVNLSQKTPFSILILGIDTGDYGRTDQGRSDVMMVATLNPNTNQTTLVSIPRDTYTTIVGRSGQDKINHAYAFGGTAMAVDTVEALLDIPIDYTVTVDMQGFAQIIDAVGGVTVVANDSFTMEGYSFVEGQTYQMDGAMALAYSRDRSVEGGDYGRQARQRQIIQAIASSVLSMNLIANYQNIITSLQGNVQVSIPFAELLPAIQNYRSALRQLNTLQLSGSGQMIDNVYYEMLDQTQLQEVQARLQSELELTSSGN